MQNGANARSQMPLWDWIITYYWVRKDLLTSTSARITTLSQNAGSATTHWQTQPSRRASTSSPGHGIRRCVSLSVCLLSVPAAGCGRISRVNFPLSECRSRRDRHRHRTDPIHSTVTNPTPQEYGGILSKTTCSLPPSKRSRNLVPKKKTMSRPSNSGTWSVGARVAARDDEIGPSDYTLAVAYLPSHSFYITFNCLAHFGPDRPWSKSRFSLTS